MFVLYRSDNYGSGSVVVTGNVDNEKNCLHEEFRL